MGIPGGWRDLWGCRDPWECRDPPQPLRSMGMQRSMGIQRSMGDAEIIGMQRSMGDAELHEQPMQRPTGMQRSMGMQRSTPAPGEGAHTGAGGSLEGAAIQWQTQWREGPWLQAGAACPWSTAAMERESQVPAVLGGLCARGRTHIAAGHRAAAPEIEPSWRSSCRTLLWEGPPPS